MDAWAKGACARGASAMGGHKQAYFDRIDDLRDQYALRQLTRNELVKLLDELKLDYDEANLIEEEQQS